MDKITSTYLRDLAVAYHKIDNRGILFDERIMTDLSYAIKKMVDSLLAELSSTWGTSVYLGITNKPKGNDNLNLGSPVQLLGKLKSLGFEVPKVRKKNKETYDVEYKESVEELVLRKIFAETSARPIQIILEIRELNTLRTRYVDSKRIEGVFYSCFNTAGTITGRRSCKKHTFGVGGNAQTFPKHYSPNSLCYKFGGRFLEGVISRPGKIFFIVDQVSAEDWPTSALAENHNALDELRNQVDRHTNLASFIFGIPVASRSRDAWKHSLERYLGKKSRHAFNYGLRGITMADQLAKEGFALPPERCQWLLDQVDKYDPSVERIFHEYIRNEILDRQLLRTPFGRECHFTGLRSNSPNYNIFNEGYSYIPQSTVGDNTGFAVFQLERECNDVVNECHDSITQEVYNDLGTVLSTYERTRRAFDRNIIFHNGITINIPIEGELGFSLGDTVKIEEFTEEGVRLAFEKLNDTRGSNEGTEETLDTGIRTVRGPDGITNGV